MAEMVFHEKHVAETVIATFNNQKADGRILHVFMHRSVSTTAVPPRSSEPALFVSDPTPTPAPKELISEENGALDGGDDIDMIEEPAYIDSRQAADQDRRERESGRAEPDVQDGSYGFAGRSQRSNNADSQTSPSDTREETRNTARPDDRESGSRRDDDRERRYENPSYQRRDDGYSYRRDDRYGNFSRGDRQSHYGNGVAAGGRGYGNGDRYGRMYSDDVMRGPRAPRGGGRGGYR